MKKNENSTKAYIDGFTFDAVKRDSDGMFTLMDLILLSMVKLAFYETPLKISNLQLRVELTGATQTTALTLQPFS